MISHNEMNCGVVEPLPDYRKTLRRTYEKLMKKSDFGKT